MDVSRCHWHSSAFPPTFSPPCQYFLGWFLLVKFPQGPSACVWFCATCLSPDHINPWVCSPQLRTEKKVCSFPFFAVSLVVTAISVCREHVQFHEKNACFVWTIHSGSYLSDRTFWFRSFACFGGWKNLFPGECCNSSQSWGFCTWCPSADVPAVFSLCCIHRERKRMISRKSILGHLL